MGPLALLKEVRQITHKKKAKKFWDFRNALADTAELYVYGEIVSGSYKWDDTDVTIVDFKDQLDKLGDIKTLNMYVSSPGGSIFTTVAMMSMLQRQKEKGVVINAYVDGVAASAAGFLIMVATNIYFYINSTLMIHKPLLSGYMAANAYELRKMADSLDTLENGSLIGSYMAKAKEVLTEDKLRELLAAETWMDANMAQGYFNITILEETKQYVASIQDLEILAKYKNTPKFIEIEAQKDPDPDPNILLKQKLELELQL